jgi:HlyD family secretion protein
MKRWIVVLAVIAVAAGGGVAWWRHSRGNGGPAFRTLPVERGDLVQTVRATGIVQPIQLVQVGTQVNGPVKKLYVDFNDLVKEGDLVAQIDPTVYEARLAQDEANLKQSEAGVTEAQAKLVQATNELNRSEELARRDMLSKSDLDAAVANRGALAAQVRVAEAAVEQARAALRLSKANLDYTTIRSPVDGVVIARNVSEGQTVVASLSAQTLFQIASDLKQIQVEASIPEADIGKIRMNQPVTFTVDAHDQDFHGTVTQIRLAASTVQNVVTYPVVIRAENAERLLFPGMTANISCEVARREDVLKIPNAALRFKPEPPAGAEPKSAAASERKPPAGTERQPSADRRGKARGPKVWVLDKTGSGLDPVPVSLGITDGSFTEVKEPAGLTAGSEVVVGVNGGAAAQSGTVNPFMPRLPGARPPR